MCFVPTKSLLFLRAGLEENGVIKEMMLRVILPEGWIGLEEEWKSLLRPE